METRSSIVLPTKYPCSMLYQLKYTFTKHKYCGCLQNCKPFSPVTVAVKMALPGWIMVPFSPQWRKWPEVGTGRAIWFVSVGQKSHPKLMGEEPPRGYDYGGFRLFPLNKFNWSDTSDLPSGKLLQSYWKLPFIYSWITHQKQWFSIAMLVYQRVKMNHQKKKHRCMNSVNHQLHPPFCHGPFSSNRMLWRGHHWPGSPTGRPGHFSGFNG